MPINISNTPINEGAGASYFPANSSLPAAEVFGQGALARGDQLYLSNGQFLSNIGTPSRSGFSKGQIMWDYTTLTGYTASNGGTLELVDGDINNEFGKPVNRAIRLNIPIGADFVAFDHPQLASAFQNPGESFYICCKIESPQTSTSVNWISLFGDTTSFANYFSAPFGAIHTGQQVIAVTQGSQIGTITATVGTPDFNNVKAFRFRIDKNPTVPLSVTFYATMISASGPNVVSMILDDANGSDLPEAGLYFNKYGLRAGFAIIGARVGQPGFMSLPQFKSLNDAGHDMCIHGASSLKSFPNLQSALDDITNNQNLVLMYGGTRGTNIYVYPNGFSERDLPDDKNAIRDYLKEQGFIASFVVTPRYAPAIGGFSRYSMGRWNLDAATTLADAQAVLDACEKGRPLMIMAHQILVSGATGGEVNRAVFRSIVDEIATRHKAGRITFMPPSEWLRACGL